MITKRLLQVISISLFFIASSVFYPGIVQVSAGGGLKFFIFPGGSTQDDSGNVQGTGDNYGSGEIQDDSGNVQGTGDNYGSGKIQE